MDKIICIYEIVNIINQNRYIGQTKDFYKRIKIHTRNLSKNKHKNDYLQNAWNKYGEGSFEFNIIEVCSIEELDEKEIYWINYFDSLNNGYNLCEGGNGQVHRELSEYSRNKISDSRKGKCCGKDNPNYRHIYTNEEKQRMSKITKDRNWTRENNPNSKSVICLDTLEVFDCIKDAAETYDTSYTNIINSCKKNIMAKGFIWMYYDYFLTLSEDNIHSYIELVKNKHKNKYIKKNKKVKCINTDEIFDSAVEAAKRYNIDKSSISKCCKGKIKYCGKDEFGNKLYWCFCNDL